MALALVMVSGLSAQCPGPPLLAHEKWNDLQRRLSHYRDIVAFLEFMCFPHRHTHARTHMLAHVFRKLSWRFWPEAILSTHKHQLSSRSTALKVRHHTEKILYTLTLFLHSNSSPSQQLQRGGGYMSKWKATFFFFFFFWGGKCCCVHWVFSRTHPVCAEV